MEVSKLKGVLPDNVLAELPAVMSKFNINAPHRLAHFLCHTAHESGDYTRKVENLNYSAKRLVEVFPRYFNAAIAEKYANNPEAIASRVYANRMGNGDEASKDGYKFCGRGYIQLTGKENYKAFDFFVDEDVLETPRVVADKYPLLSAAFFWNQRGLNAVVDRAPMDVKATTKIVNGGYLGLEDRQAKFDKFIKILQ